MSDIGAPAAAPAAPAAAPAAPAAPSAPTSSPNPRGWGPKPSNGAAPTGQVSAPAPSAQQVATGAPPVEREKPTTPGRGQHVIKHKLDDGREIDVDASEYIENYTKGLKRKVKVDGQEREVGLDELEKRYTLADSAYRRFEEAANLKKQMEAREAQIRQGLQGLQERLGNPETAAAELRSILGEERYTQMVRGEMAKLARLAAMTPEQRAELQRRQEAEKGLTERERQIQERERQVKEAEARYKQAQHEAQTKQLFEQYQQQVPVHLKNAGVPVTPEAIGRWTELKRQALRAKIPVSDADIASKVGEEMRALAAHYAQALPPEELRKTLGPAAEKLRQAEVERVQSQPGRKAQTVASAASMPKDIRTPEEYRRFLRAQDRERARKR